MSENEKQDIERQRIDYTVIVKSEAHAVPWKLDDVRDVDQEAATKAKGFPHPGNMLRLPGGCVVPMQFDASPTEVRNGNLMTEVLRACADRLQVFQARGSQMSSRETALAITKIEEAIHWLNARQLDRQDRGVRFEDKP